MPITPIPAGGIPARETIKMQRESRKKVAAAGDVDNIRDAAKLTISRLDGLGGVGEKQREDGQLLGTRLDSLVGVGLDVII